MVIPVNISGPSVPKPVKACAMTDCGASTEFIIELSTYLNNEPLWNTWCGCRFKFSIITMSKSIRRLILQHGGGSRIRTSSKGFQVYFV